MVARFGGAAQLQARAETQPAATVTKGKTQSRSRELHVGAVRSLTISLEGIGRYRLAANLDSMERVPAQQPHE